MQLSYSNVYLTPKINARDYRRVTVIGNQERSEEGILNTNSDDPSLKAVLSHTWLA